jgi:hypothetical protein
VGRGKRTRSRALAVIIELSALQNYDRFVPILPHL